MLDGYDTRREREERKEKEKMELSICPKCEIPMIDYTFMHGSRIAGTLECLECKYKIIL